MWSLWNEECWDTWIYIFSSSLCAFYKWTRTIFGLDSSHVQTSIKLKTNKSQMSEVWNMDVVDVGTVTAESHTCRNICVQVLTRRHTEWRQSRGGAERLILPQRGPAETSPLAGGVRGDAPYLFILSPPRTTLTFPLKRDLNVQP